MGRLVEIYNDTITCIVCVNEGGLGNPLTWIPKGILQSESLPNFRWTLRNQVDIEHCRRRRPGIGRLAHGYLNPVRIQPIASPDVRVPEIVFGVELVRILV